MLKYFHIIFIFSFLFFINQAAHTNDFQSMEQDLSDSIITTKITTKFAKNTHLNPLKLSISTQKGVVTLSGYVKDKQAFVDALRIAKATHGVARLNVANLEIKPVNTAFTDAYITAKVETAILEAKVLDDESIPLVGINATTVNGMVTLTGEVKQRKSITAILKRANRVHGVEKIISNLRVNDLLSKQ